MCFYAPNAWRDTVHKFQMIKEFINNCKIVNYSLDITMYAYKCNNIIGGILKGEWTLFMFIQVIKAIDHNTQSVNIHNGWTEEAPFLTWILNTWHESWKEQTMYDVNEQ